MYEANQDGIFHPSWGPGGSLTPPKEGRRNEYSGLAELAESSAKASESQSIPSPISLELSLDEMLSLATARTERAQNSRLLDSVRKRHARAASRLLEAYAKGQCLNAVLFGGGHDSA